MQAKRRCTVFCRLPGHTPRTPWQHGIARNYRRLASCRLQSFLFAPTCSGGYVRSMYPYVVTMRLAGFQLVKNSKVPDRTSRPLARIFVPRAAQGVEYVIDECLWRDEL